MNNFNNILIAYDGSDGSMNAVKLGIDMKKSLDSNITILQVIEEKMTGAPIQTQHTSTMPNGGFALEGMNMYANNVRNKVPQEQPKHNQQDPVDEKARELHETLAKENIDAKVDILVGDPAKSICNYAEEHNKDLIIIGSRGLGGLKKFILGSVSDKVTNTATIPVLVAK
ncbi:universal stress protein [Sutcliffiella deserti]|uniref:universal stress protein n=1 Tax=Sutcliffiella deserti TaxID=2875501 RepID=UPI001CBA89E2|nr:universal stress protein [Sutcliffiella deserti]